MNEAIYNIFKYDSFYDGLSVYEIYESDYPITLDYMACRKIIKDLTNWDNIDDKKIMAKHFIQKDRELRLTVLSEEEEAECSKRYNKFMRACRTERINKLTASMWNNSDQHLLDSYSQYFTNYINGFDQLYDIVADKYLSLIYS